MESFVVLFYSSRFSLLASLFSVLCSLSLSLFSFTGIQCLTLSHCSTFSTSLPLSLSLSHSLSHSHTHSHSHSHIGTWMFGLMPSSYYELERPVLHISTLWDVSLQLLLNDFYQTLVRS